MRPFEAALRRGGPDVLHVAWVEAETRRRELIAGTARELSEKSVHVADESHLIRGEN